MKSKSKSNINDNQSNITEYHQSPNHASGYLFGILALILTSTLLIIITTNPTSALTYSNNVDMTFTFTPTLSINLSSNDLIIPKLAPGTSEDSNIITVNVATNNATGYSLSASTGSTTNATTDLIQASTTNKFASIATDASLTSLTTDNTWGYSFSTDSGTNWSNYSGLPLYTADTGAILADTTTSANTAIDFKIAARASDTQASGKYTNVVNFKAVAKPSPISLYDAFANAGKEKINGYYKMQDMSTNICSAVDVIESKIQAIDTRDGHIYWIAKLKDGNCWMLQNLRLGQNTDTLALTSADSNVDISYTLDGKLADGMFTYDAYSGNGNTLTMNNDSNQYYCTDDYGCYYNWYTATASSGTSATQNQDVDYSICPAGWTLPSGSTSGQFQALYGRYNSRNSMLVDNPTTTKENTTGETPGFLLGGFYYDTGARNVGNYGFYWSRTSNHSLYLSTGTVQPTYTHAKFAGLAVRCLAQ